MFLIFVQAVATLVVEILLFLFKAWMANHKYFQKKRKKRHKK